MRTLDRPTLPEFSSASEDPLLRKRIGAAVVDLESARAYLLRCAAGTEQKYAFDRFWRNARTFSTHDATDAKEVWIGDWYLSGKEPPFVAMLRA